MKIEEELAEEYLNALNNGKSHEEKERAYQTYINNIEGMKMNMQQINRTLLIKIKSKREEYIKNNYQTEENKA